MISPLLSPSNMPTVSGPGDAAPLKGADGEAQDAFSRLLSMLGAAAQGVESEEAPAGTGKAAGDGELEEEAAPAAALPDLAGTGKILPADAETLPEAAANAVPADAALAALALVAPQAVLPGASDPAIKLAQPPPFAPTPQMSATLPLAAPAEAEGAKPAPQPSVAIQVAPLPASGEGAATPRDPAPGAAKPAREPAAKLQPTAAPSENTHDPAAGDRPAAEPAVKTLTKIAAEPAQLQTPAPAQPALAAAPAVTSDAAPSVAADKPAIETGIARELSRIVDSLASAREAMTAKGATLALDHAEFGELSLRFDQRRDGQLGVQIAAADPDAHRAVAAAVADRLAFAQPDASQQNAQSGGNGSARGALADRDGGSGEGNAARHERHEERRRADTETNHSAGKGPRGDSAAIYA